MTDAYSPVPELNSLKEFDERTGNEFYANGFQLVEFGKPRPAAAYSGEQEFLDRPGRLARGGLRGREGNLRRRQKPPGPVPATRM
ncbi:hypothetical protein T261_8485 [Streptomyces lydicus]|nr:hypothetical protein T261_8485 [Streptomyces lydicus]